MDERVRSRRRVELHEPVMLAGWPGLGKVAILSEAYLAQRLESRELAEIEPEGFFRVAGVQVRGGVILPPVTARNVFSFVPHARPAGDLVLFSGSDQPLPGREWDYARLVIDVARSLGVRRVYTTAAMVTQNHHKAPCQVFGVANRDALTGELLRHGVTLVGEGVIGGMNGLLLAAAHDAEMEAVCLLGEVPHYISEMENPKAALAVLQVFVAMTGLLVDLAPLEEAARSLEERLDLVLEQIKDQVVSTGEEELDQSEPPGGGVSGPIN